MRVRLCSAQRNHIGNLALDWMTIALVRGTFAGQRIKHANTGNTRELRKMLLRTSPLWTGCIAIVLAADYAKAQSNETLIPVGQPPDISCDEEQTDSKNHRYANEDEKFILSVRDTGCQAHAYNERHKSDPAGEQQVVYVTPDPENPHNVLFGFLTLNEAKTANRLCKILTMRYAAKAVADPQLGILVGALGKKRCDDYFDLAVTNNPLLIVFPTMAPEAKLTVDVLRTGRDAAVHLSEHFKDHPAHVRHSAPLVTLGAQGSTGGAPRRPPRAAQTARVRRPRRAG